MAGIQSYRKKYSACTKPDIKYFDITNCSVINLNGIADSEKASKIFTKRSQVDFVL